MLEKIGDDVQRAKLAPDVFLAATARLCVPPAECLVLEDAPNGVRAARSAGMQVIAVSTSFALEALAEASSLSSRCPICHIT